MPMSFKSNVFSHSVTTAEQAIETLIINACREFELASDYTKFMEDYSSHNPFEETFHQFNSILRGCFYVKIVFDVETTAKFSNGTLYYRVYKYGSDQKLSRKSHPFFIDECEGTTNMVFTC